jgi:hypothetical protein
MYGVRSRKMPPALPLTRSLVRALWGDASFGVRPVRGRRFVYLGYPMTYAYVIHMLLSPHIFPGSWGVREPALSNSHTEG